MKNTTITWIGHACFAVEKDQYKIIFDPYKDGSVPGLDDVRETANLVLCSHEHGDHSGTECVTMLSEIGSPFTVTKLPTFHDHHEGAHRGPNTIHLLEADGVKIAHLGDLGCHPTPEQMDCLQGLDVLMIPVGGFFTIDGREAAQLVKELQPKTVLPMHYRSDVDGFGYDKIGTVTDFTEAMQGSSVMVSDESSLNLDEVPEAQIVILAPQNMQIGYVTFEITGRDGAKHEMAVIDEFEFEKNTYVAAAEIKEDTIMQEGIYIYRSVIDGDDFKVEEIKKQFDYNRIAKAYMEME